MAKIVLHRSNKLQEIQIPLPGSKSESNRALIINALCEQPGAIDNLAIARDTEILQALLSADRKIYNARDAGTVMRFMTAYLSVTQNNAQITGTDRMKKRPIGILVEALQELGAEISYLEEAGYPPMKISRLQEQEADCLKIDSNVSSQYISALLMIAPALPKGLSLELTGNPVSTPYINMTVSIMQHFGVKVNVNERTYRIAAQAYKYKPYQVEADWSGASYWYAIFALADLHELRLHGLKANSYQGDSVVAKLMEGFGVQTTFVENVAVLSKSKMSLPDEIDFINCPDLAQTFAVLCALMNHKCTFLGLQTLKIKETDRVEALKTELQKLGADFIEHKDSWQVIPASGAVLNSLAEVQIESYDDHRMVMAFAALATKTNVVFDDAEVVNKSYPSFWQDLASVGFVVEGNSLGVV